MANSIAYGDGIVAQVSVTDFQRSVKWFGEKLGFEPDYLVEEMGWGELKTFIPGFTIGVNKSDAVTPSDSVVLVMSVKDVAAARASLEGQGVAFDGPTEEIPGMVKLATFRDPDGNAFSLAQSLQG
jgi:CreA protein